MSRRPRGLAVAVPYWWRRLRKGPFVKELPQPVWPVVLLGALELADAAVCVRPIPGVRRCLEGVNFPERYWPAIAPVKAAAGVGLLAGTRVPGLGLVTNACVVAYFVTAAGAHVRAHDFGWNFRLS